MSIKRWGWAAVMMLMACVSAKANTATVYFNGDYAFANNGVGIPPYMGTLNGQAAQFYCVDFSHDITGNTSWQATVTPITPTTNYSGTRLDSATDYAEIAWLLDQSLATSNQTTQAELQWAVWSFSGGGNPYGTNSMLLTEAYNAVKSGNFNPDNWEILTPKGSYGQEFFVQTPEPSTMLLLGFGLVGLAMMSRRKCLAS